MTEPEQPVVVPEDSVSSPVLRARLAFDALIQQFGSRGALEAIAAVRAALPVEGQPVAVPLRAALEHLWMVRAEDDGRTPVSQSRKMNAALDAVERAALAVEAVRPETPDGESSLEDSARGQTWADARTLLGYLWDATGKDPKVRVRDLFGDDDPLVKDVQRVLRVSPLPAVRPETDIDERAEPVVRTHETFGDWIDFGPLDADSIIVSGNDGFGRKPLRLLLPHQLYVKDVEALLEKHPRIEVVPVRSRDWMDVNRILAVYSATPLAERPE